MNTAPTIPKFLILAAAFGFGLQPWCQAAAPTGTDKTFSVLPSSTTTLTQTDWGFFDPDSPPDAFAAVKITTLPATGILQVDGVNATAGQSIFFSNPAGANWTARSVPGGSNHDWYAITSSADGTKLAAVESSGFVYTSIDSGATWIPKAVIGPCAAITSSADGTKLAAVQTGGQIYTSTDSGNSWTPRETNRLWISITSSADGSKLAAVVDGGQIYTSTNSGVSWTARESNRAWRSIASSTDGSKLAAVAWGDNIYTSTNSGVSWMPQTSGSDFRYVASSADGSMLAVVIYNGPIFISSNSGLSWTSVGPVGNWISITSSADGTKLAAAQSGGKIYTSTNAGVSWTARESSRSWYSIASSADGNQLAAVEFGGKIYTSTGTSSEEPIITYIAASSPGTDAFDFQVQDASAVNNLDPSPDTLVFHVVSPVAPEGTDKSFSIPHTTTTTLTPADWGFSDSDFPFQDFVAVKITTLPAAGTLQVDGVNATAGQTAYVRSGSGPAGAVWDTKFDAGFRNWQGICSSTNGLKLAAVVHGGRIHTSTDAGEHWTPRESNREWRAITSSSTGSNLAAVAENGQIYTSGDSGLSWTPRESNRRWRAIASSSSGTKLAAAENFGYIYTSIDSGATWTARTSAWGAWQAIASSADGTKLAAVEDGGDIHTSSDSGVTWTPRTMMGQWQSIASSADGTKLAAVGREGQIHTSIDSGVTWTARIQVNGNGFAAISSSTDGTRLVAGQESGGIYTSIDSGMTWRYAAQLGTWKSIASNVDGTRLAAVQNGGLYSSVGSAQTITYTAPIGTGTTSFTFQVQDSAPVANLDLSPNTLNFDYAPSLNPTITAPSLGLYSINGLYYAPMTVPVRNTTASSIQGFRLSVDLSAYAVSYPAITLLHPSSPGGTTPAYVDFPFPVAVGQTSSVQIYLYLGTSVPNFIDPLLTVTPITSSAAGGPLPVGLTFSSVTLQPEFDPFRSVWSLPLTWSSTPGSFYRIYYSDDLSTWFPSPSPVQATHTETSWRDEGPPFTGTVPGTARFYKISEIPSP